MATSLIDLRHHLRLLSIPDLTRIPVLCLAFSPDVGCGHRQGEDYARRDYTVQSPVPEPATITLALLGLASLAGRHYMRRRS